MRVCLVTLDFPPFRSSGLTIYAENLARGLAERGYAVTVVAAERPKPVDSLPMPTNVSTVFVPVGRTDWLGLGWQAARYLHAVQGSFDIVHFTDVHFAFAYRGPFVASAFQSFRQRLTSHHGQPYHTSRRNYAFRLTYYNVARWLLEQPSVRRARYILMASRATQEEFVTHYHADPRRISLVYSGIDLRRFANLPSRDEARRHLGLADDVPTLLYIGFSTPRKGVEYLAQALDRMRTPAQMLMVGKWEAGYQARFLAAAGEARARVRMIGYVPEAEVLSYFAAADALVFPTLLEGFGYPPAEAMAAGLPVVTTTAWTAGELAADAALIVPPADSAALADALDRVLSEPGLAERLRQAGRERAYRCFDLSQAVVQTEAIYELVAGVG